MSKQLPAEVQEFIAGNIDSLEQLEILLLLREYQQESWTVERLYDRIRSNVESIRLRLEQLAGQRLVAIIAGNPPSFQYQPADEKLKQAVEQLSVAYRERRISVLEQVFSKPLLPLKGFAEAFRIRKDDKNG